MEYAAALGMSHRLRQGLRRQDPRAALPPPAALGAGRDRPAAGVAGDARGRAHRLPARWRRPPTSTGHSPRQPGRARGPRSAGSSRRPWPATTPPQQKSGAGARPTDGGSTSRPTSSTPPAPSWSAAASTSPTPSTSKPPSAGRATQLAELGSTDSLDVRRSIAVGEIARQQLALDLDTGEIHPGHGRSVVLNVHLTEAAIAGVGGNIARCGNTRTPVLLDQVKDWCQTPVRSPSSRSRTSAPTTTSRPTRSPTGSSSRSRCSTTPASSPTAPAAPNAATTTTSTPTNPTAPAERPAPTTSPPLPTTPPRQDPRTVALPPHPSHRLRVDHPARLPHRPRPPRHPPRDPARPLTRRRALSNQPRAPAYGHAGAPARPCLGDPLSNDRDSRGSQPAGD